MQVWSQCSGINETVMDILYQFWSRYYKKNNNKVTNSPQNYSRIWGYKSASKIKGKRDKWQTSWECEM